MNCSSIWLVCIEVKRVQTFLFAVPKLKAMLGANAMIGETIRNGLFDLANKNIYKRPDVIENPFLAKDQKELSTLEDPLCRQGYLDDPKANYSAGILSCDGGHFRATFGSEDSAKAFADAAQVLLTNDLPSLRYEVRTGKWCENNTDWQYESECSGDSQALFRPVYFATCELSDKGNATEELSDKGTATEAPYEARGKKVSLAVSRQLEKGQEVQKGTTSDMVGLLQDKWPYSSGKRVTPTPVDLESVAGGPGHYLALVHLDGNSIGSRSNAFRDGLNNPEELPDGITHLQRWFKKEAKIEHFFHSMRRAVRIAVTNALKKVFPETDRKLYMCRPYQVLMLGGDDLLLVCRADKALPLVVEYARELSGLNLADEKPLGVGAGVVICQPSMPIHRMHALVEELAASAKRLSRGCKDPSRSVVDWMVLSQSTIESIERHRLEHETVRYKVNGTDEQLILSRKPYFVLNQLNQVVPQSPNRLESMLDAAKKIQNQAARSQLKNLPDFFRQGRFAAEFAFNDLPKTARDAFKSVGLPEPWIKLNTPANTHITSVFDLIEIIEISRLGRRTKLSQSVRAKEVVKEAMVTKPALQQEAQ